MSVAPTPGNARLQDRDDPRFLIEDAAQIRAFLQTLIDRRALIRASNDTERVAFLTMLLALPAEAGGVYLDPSQDARTNARACAADRLDCESDIDGVKLRFTLRGLAARRLDHLPALFAPLPAALSRLQRRNHYRLVAPVTDALTCAIPDHQASDGPTTFLARIVDLSAGGLCLLLPPRGLELWPDRVFPDCRLLLPDGAPLGATLKVRNLYHLSSRQAGARVRAGCQFVDLEEAAVAQISRYIFRLARERALLGLPA